jgi:murein DD-endopeptidase MepM/ murein hydrolase activator NlpD
VTREFIPGNPARGVQPHLGIDVAGPQDSAILAAAPGVVVRTGEDRFLGNFVEIQHGLGYLTVYGHCSRIAVNRHDQVDGGQVIAYMGKSGQATGAHLHFEIWHQGEAVDPRQILTGDPAPN